MPRRSRGCQECRKRRIGCDGALPSCRQCVITSRPCSGPVQGPIFIDQTGITTSRYLRPAVRSDIDTNRIIRQPSPRAIDSMAYVSTFISTVTASCPSPSRMAWLWELECIPLDDKMSPLDLSVQALALAYCGMESKNHTAVMESCRMYGEAMTKHSKALSRRSDVLPPAMLYTSILLALFETIWSTNSSAYAIHLTAARSMLNLGNWEVGYNETLRQVAILVQKQTLFLMIASPLDDIGVELENEAWSHALCNQYEESQPVADRLTAQIFRLWRVICTQQGNTDLDETTLFLSNTISKIQRIWDDCQDVVVLRGENLSHGSAGKIVYEDRPTALLVAYFATAQVMLSLTGFPTLSPSFQMAEDPCQAILSCASYLFRDRAAIDCVGHDMFFPLTFVALHGTSLKYRKLAHAFLEGQARGIAFEGLRAMAVQLIKPSSA